MFTKDEDIVAAMLTDIEACAQITDYLGAAMVEANGNELPAYISTDVAGAILIAATTSLKRCMERLTSSRAPWAAP